MAQAPNGLRKAVAFVTLAAMVLGLFVWVATLSYGYGSLCKQVETNQDGIQRVEQTTNKILDILLKERGAK